MALSAITSATTVTRTVFGNKRVVTADVVIGNDTWPNGGIAFTPVDLGLATIEFMACESAGLAYKYDYTNSKLLAYTSNGGGATTLFVVADGSTPNETIRITAFGYGLE